MASSKFASEAVLSINRLLSSAILVLALLVAGVGGYLTLIKLNMVGELTIASARLDVIRALGGIIQNLNTERGLTTLDLQSVAPDDSGALAALGKAREQTAGFVAAAEAQIAGIQGKLDDAAQLSAQMAELKRRLDDFRQFGNDKLQLAVDRRGDAAAGALARINAVNDVISAVLRAQLQRISVNGEAYRYVGFADQVSALRDIAGREVTTTLPLIIARRPASAHERKVIDALDGRAEQIWSQLSFLLDEATTPDAIKAALGATKTAYIDQLRVVEKKVFDAFDTGDFPVDGPTWRKHALSIWPTVLALREAFYDQAAKEIGTARAAALAGAVVAGLVLAFTLVLAAGIMLLVRRRVTAPIGAMTQAMGQIAEGELATAIPGAGRTDEIGEMAKAVLVFRNTALAKLERDREIEAERRQSETERRSAESQAIERERALVSQSIGAGLAGLAAQDLAFRMTDELPPAYRRLQTDFNKAISELEGAMVGVAQNVHAMEAVSNQIASAADNLSQRTEQQAASLEETAAALEEITATVDKTADGARNANQMVGSAKVEAQKSGEVVRQAIEAMNGIEKSSKQIGQIIGVIDEIAFQTNLLALNAGVEAARAGDAGRGFAVVASEVRALAQRSAEAAKEIKGLISASTAQVDAGVDLVADSGKALARIVGQIGEVSTVVAAIANGATEQAAALKEVNTAVNQMDQMTQRNAAMVEETTAASHALLKEASDLISSVSRFRVSKDTAREPEKRAAGQAAARRRNAS
jgi:methyl-accepting chemotaxis protein